MDRVCFSAPAQIKCPEADTIHRSLQCPSTSAHERTTAGTCSKAKHTFGPAFFILQLNFDRAIGIQAIFNPALNIGPQRGQQQVVECREQEQLKGSEGRRTKDSCDISELIDSDHRSNRCCLEHVVKFVP